MNKVTLYSILATSAILFSVQQNEPKVEVKKMNKFFNEHYSFVRAGQVLLDKDTFAVQSFIMSSGEITNFNYQEFLADLKKNGKDELYKKSLPDTTQWSKMQGNLGPMTTHYFSHAAFRNYPVVNITKENAQDYCKWLTEQFKSRLPEGQSLTFRLPKKAEWLRAACGDDLDAPYAWKGSYLRNEGGNYLANFVRIPESAIARNENNEFVVMKDYPRTFDRKNYNGYHGIIAPSKSYFPNEFSLYNMNGNVAELLDDTDEVIGGSWYDTGYDIRNQSTKKYKGASPTVGFRVVATITQTNQPWFKPKS